MQCTCSGERLGERWVCPACAREVFWVSVHDRGPVPSELLELSDGSARVRVRESWESLDLRVAGGRSGLGVPAYLENGVGSGLLIKLVVMPAALGTFLVLPAALAQAALVQWWGYPLPLASALLFCAGVTVSGLAGEVQRLEHVFAVELLNTRSRVDATGLRVWHHGIPELELDHVRNLRVESAEPDAPAQLVAVTDAGEQVLARGFERQDLEFVALKLADRLRGEA